MHNIHLASVVTLVTLGALVVTLGCAADIQPGALAGGPVATLACPSAAQVGVPFTIEGTATSALALEEITLSLPPFDSVLDTTMTVTPAAPGLLTARLAIVDAGRATAEARCRILVAGDALDAGDDLADADGDDDLGGGDGDGGGDGGGDGSGGGGDTGLPDEVPAPAGTPVSLTGQFALVSYDRPALDSLTLDPNRQCAPSPSVTLVDLEQQGAQISMTMQTCSFTLPSVRVLGADIQVSTVPDALLRALPVQGPYVFDIGEAVAGASFAPPLAQIGQPLVLGAILEDPVNDDLPWLDWDDRVIDADANGFPGVSILSTFGAQHLVMRHTIRAFSGVVRSSNLIEGANAGDYRVDNESSLLSLLNVLVPAGAGMPSTFSMRRVDGQLGALDLRGADGALTCDELRAQRAALEAAFPPLANPADCPSY